MWELNYKQSWALKNWCFGTVVLEKTIESPLDCREIKPVHPKGNQSWIFIGRTDAEAETSVLWAPDVKNWLIGKDPDVGKNWRWEEKGIRGWDGWMASPTQWTWVWARSGSWWWTGKPGVLQSMGLQRVRHDWVTELIYTKSYTKYFRCIFFLISSLYQMHKVIFIGDTAEHLSSLYFPSLLPNRTAAFKSIHLSSLQPTSQENCPISIFRDGLDWYKNNSITTSSN